MQGLANEDTISIGGEHHVIEGSVRIDAEDKVEAPVVRLKLGGDGLVGLELRQEGHLFPFVTRIV